MNKDFISRDGKVFEFLSPGVMYETSVQNLVQKNSEAIFLDHVSVRIEPYFETAAGDVKPDLVVIKRDGSSWGLVEVEVEGHSWSAHILPQLGKLKHANFSNMRSNDRRKLLEKFEGLLPNDLLLKALDQKPEVYLAIHGSSQSAIDKVNELRVHAVNLAIFSCPPNDYILLVESRIPDVPTLTASAHRDKNPMFGNLWKINNQKIASFLQGTKRALVEAFGVQAYWPISISADEILLSPPSNINIADQLTEATVEFYARDMSFRIEQPSK
jgi:hypothetical protein